MPRKIVRRRGRAGTLGQEQAEEGERPAGNEGSTAGTLRYITWVAAAGLARPWFCACPCGSHPDHGFALCVGLVLAPGGRRLPLLPQSIGGTTTRPRRRKTTALLRHRTSNHEKRTRPRANRLSQPRGSPLTLMLGTRVTGTPVRVLARVGEGRGRTGRGTPLQTVHGEA